MQLIFQNIFQHRFNMSVTRMCLNACAVTLLDNTNVLDYTRRYQIVFDKLLSLLNKKSWMLKKTMKMILQRSLLCRLRKDYAAFVTAIETNQKDKTINLADSILQVIRHAEINKDNNRDNADVKILAANIYRALKGTCTTKEFVEKGVATHYID